MAEEQIKELMQRRIRQILVHSCIYYTYNENIIPDYVYDTWGNELIELIKAHPEYLNELEYGKDFRNYVEMASGFNLPYREPQILNRAYQLLQLHKTKSR